MERSDVLACYERLVLAKTRSRIVSCVYGNKFTFGGAERLGADFGAKVLTSEEEAKKAGERLGFVDRRKMLTSRGVFRGKVAVGIGLGLALSFGVAGYLYLGRAKGGQGVRGGSGKK